MQWRDNNNSYGLVSMLLHWGVAILLAVMVFLGWRVTNLGRFDPALEQALFWHQGLGVIVAIVMLIRLVWRNSSKAPPAIAVSPTQRYLLRKVRVLMYLLVFLAAITGYLIATGSSQIFSWFGLLQMPTLAQFSMSEVAQIKQLHAYSVWTLCALIALHVAATLKHQLIDKRPVLQRMLGKR